MEKRLMIITAIGFVVFLIFGTVWGRKNPTPTLNLYEKRIAYLKKHEQEMTDYVKSENPKIESVQFDWDSVDMGTIGNGTLQGAGEILTIDGKFNNISDSSFYLQFNIDTFNKMPDIENMTAYNSFRVGGTLYE